MGEVPPVVNFHASPLTGIGVHLQGVTQEVLEPITHAHIKQTDLMKDFGVSDSITVTERSIHSVAENTAEHPGSNAVKKAVIITIFTLARAFVLTMSIICHIRNSPALSQGHYIAAL